MKRADFDARLAPLYDKYAKMDVEQIAADAAARQTGERMFLTYCSQCHGSDAGGGRGFPNLRDRDWLYGGAPATIIETVTGGRMGVMPAFGPVLGEDGLRNVTAYVRSLSGLPHDSLRAQLGKTVFTANCAALRTASSSGSWVPFWTDQPDDSCPTNFTLPPRSSICSEWTSPVEFDAT